MSAVQSVQSKPRNIGATQTAQVKDFLSKHPGATKQAAFKEVAKTFYGDEARHQTVATNYYRIIGKKPKPQSAVASRNGAAANGINRSATIGRVESALKAMRADYDAQIKAKQAEIAVMEGEILRIDRMLAASG